MVDGPGPFELGPRSEERKRVTTLLSELEMTRRFTLSVVRGLTPEQLAATPVVAKNSIGSVLSHLAAAEGLMQRVTTGGTAFPAGAEEEQRAFGFAGDPLAGSPLEAYEQRLAAVRQRTLDLFASRDDSWLAHPRPFFGNPANHHYFWFHLMLDEGRHQGQVILLRRYLLPEPEPDFGPYDALAG